MRLFIIMELERRHEGHHDGHSKNVSIGQFIFLCTIIGVIALMVRNSMSNFVTNKLKRLPIWLVSLAWLVFLTYFIFVYGGPGTEGLNILAKRAGRVCYSLLPLTFFLTLRPSPLPNTYYINLLFIHKWVSRSVVIIGFLHGILYLIYFIQSQKFYKVYKLLNFLGVIASVGFLVIGISSLRPIRRRWYRVFYGLHYPLSIVCLVLGAIHARPGVNMLVLWCGFIILGQLLYRLFTSQNIYLTSIEHVSPTLIGIKLPRAVIPDYFDIGSHIRLSKGSLWDPRNWLLRPTHPYTIASIPQDEEQIKLLIRKNDEKNTLTASNRGKYTLLGPFPSKGMELLFDENFQKNVAIFAGGSGISFAAPIIRQLAMQNSNNQIKLVWIIKDRSDYPALEFLDLKQFIKFGSISVYITGSNSNNNYKELENDVDFVLDDDAEEFEIDDLSPDNHDDDLACIHHGRPHFSIETEGLFNGGVERNWVVSCGPKSLVDDVKRWKNKHYKNDVQFLSETYAL